MDADYYHMVLLAKNEFGYRNLLALTTAAHLDGYYYKPPMTRSAARHAEGLIGTSACLGGEVPRLAEGTSGQPGRPPTTIGPSWVRRTSTSRCRTTACCSRTACIHSWWSWRAT